MSIQFRPDGLLAGLVLAGSNRVALSEDYAAPVPDIRWAGLVQHYVAWAPSYPYRFLPDSSYGRAIAEQRHLVPSYYIGWLPYQTAHRATVTLPFGTYLMQPLHSLDAATLGIGPGRLIRGPGIDRPFEHPDARYDPWSGYYKDATGRFWDLFGGEVAHPPKRRYIAKRKLWADSYGDLWTASGRHVGNDPAYRTAR
jgi:hypothetical protein